MEDLAILKSMVNMTVLSIGDPNMIRDILKLSMDYEGPMYIRLAQGKKDRQLYEPGTKEFSIGGSVTAREGKDITIIAHGEMVGESLDVAEEAQVYAGFGDGEAQRKKYGYAAKDILAAVKEMCK